MNSWDVPPTTAFRRLAKLADDFPSQKTYLLSRDLLDPSSESLKAAVSLAIAVDSLAKRRLEPQKTGEAHFSPEFLSKVFEKAINLPNIDSLVLQPLQFPNDGRFIEVIYTGTIAVPGLLGETEHAVSVRLNLCFTGPRVQSFTLVVSHIAITIAPDVEDPSVFPPDLFAYQKRRKVQEAQSAIVDLLREPTGDSKALWELIVPSSNDIPSPYALFLIGGASVLLKSLGAVLRRSPRDNTHDLAIEVGIDFYKDAINDEVSYRNGDVTNDENSYQLVEVRNIRVADASHIKFDIYYDFHEFIGGDKGCNFLYCFDYRMWIGARDDVPYGLRIAARLESKGDIKIVATPSFERYEVDDDFIYSKNLRLIIDLVDLLTNLKRKISRFVNTTVNDALSSMDEQEIELQIPQLPDGVVVHSASVRLDGNDGQESMRIDLDFKIDGTR
ncbi:MAG: hypothetical protein K9M08_24070 [Pirellula sp.]|nr:hypothetical protein [Pirellula sp.]